jgi:hypothetical protein
MNRRRFLAASALMALLPASVRAQLSPLGGCTPTFLNGLLQFDPECALTVPGAPFEFSPPSHLITPFTETGASTSTDELESRKLRQREKRKTHRNTVQDQQSDRLAMRRLQQDRRQDNARDRRLRRNQKNLHCNDFLYQQDAQAYYDSEHYDKVKDRGNLDPNDSGIACEGLPVRDYCDQFQYQEDAQDFFENSEYDSDKDPLNLDPNNNGKACQNLPKKPQETTAG